MAVTYLYEAPIVEVLACEPSVGVPAGGTAVVILGRGFQVGATVTFDGVASTGAPVVESSERITCVTPAHALGAVDVVVTNLDASTGTLAGGFTYESVAPATAVTYRTPAGTGATRLRTETSAPTITQALGQASTFSFSAAVEPAGAQIVEYRTFGVRLFLGPVTHTAERVDGAARLQVWDTTAHDLSQRLGRIYPVGEWISTSGTTILTALLAFAPGFSAVIEGGLPVTTLKADGRRDLWTLLVDVCARCGAKLFLDGTTLHVFTVDSGFDPPATVTEANPDLLWPEGGQNPVTIERDYSQLRNVVTVYGAEGISATLHHPASIGLYGAIPFPIDDNTLTTAAECLARAQAELDAYALPIPIAHYATRDLKSTVGKTVVINLTRPLINATFLITAVAIDQLQLAVAATPTRPRFTVTARPAFASVRSGGDQSTRILDTVIDLAAAADRSPRLSGAIESEPGGPTTIPDGSIPATKLAGCLDSDLLTATGVGPGPYGNTGTARLVTFTVDAAGRITAAATDTVPVAKTDGSQPYTAPQSMGGFPITDLDDPVDPQDAATKAYVDAGATTILTADNPVGGFVYDETPAGAIPGSVFTTTVPYASLRVFLNGLRQKVGSDYTETGPDEFTMAAALVTDDLLTTDYRGGSVPEVVFDSFGNVIEVAA